MQIHIQGKMSTGKRKTGQGDAKFRPRDGERRGERKAGTEPVPREITEGRVRGRSSRRRSPTRARRGQQERTSPMAHRKGGDREIQTEKRKRRNALFLAPDATPECAPCRRQVPGGRCQYHNPS